MEPARRTKSLFGPRRPPRLERVFQCFDSPVYFITICTSARQKRLACPEVDLAFRSFAERGMAEKGIAVGRYVIMPDHIHLFVRLPRDQRLSQWARLLKTHLAQSVVIPPPSRERPMWQRGFFDHLMRSGESYGEKWEYVRGNPVRAGLVSTAEEWPFQGEIHRIEF